MKDSSVPGTGPGAGLSGNLSVPSKSRLIVPVAIFFVILILGEFYVKWDPYYHKAFTAAAKHSLGASIVSGKTDVPPAFGFVAAWQYAVKYFLDIWQALVVGILVGAGIQVLLPKDWILRMFARKSFGSVLAAGTLALPGMMCTCCGAPVAVGLRKQQASVGAGLAFWMGNPVLNPATIVFMGFVLGWKFAVFRIFFGIILVFGVSLLADRVASQRRLPDSELSSSMTNLETSSLITPLETPKSDLQNVMTQQPLWLRFLAEVWKMATSMLPAYILFVLVVGGVRAWLFPVVGAHATGLLWLIGLALAGTLFVIPTAGEIPIIQTLMHYGLGIGPAAALLLTLPALSVPSMAIVWKSFPRRAILFAAASTFLIGILGGLVAMVTL